MSDYITLSECINDGSHLIDVDRDGYCNACGHQDAVLDCGHEPTKTEGIGTGTAYKTDEDGKQWSMCYHCAYIETMDDIVMTGVVDDNLHLPVLYVSMDGTRLTTWDGQTVSPRIRWGERHNFSSKWEDRRHFQARITYGADVVNVYGVGSPGMYAVCRRNKSDVEQREAVA